MLHWKKKGQIFDPTVARPHEWMQEYAQLPVGLVKDEDTLRIYFACRPRRGADMQYVSRSSYIDVNLNDFTEVKGIADAPIMEMGGPGTFDEFGSMTSSFVRVDDKIYAYYTGWSRLETVPYNMAIGLAVSSDGGDTFTRLSDGPILGQNHKEPFVISGPIVRVIDGVWHMWYLVGTKWLLSDGKYEPVYRIAHATSADGIEWARDGKPIIEALTEDECQVSFALFRHGDRWYSLFAHRQPTDFRKNSSRAYRMGCAWSTDLESWHRDDSLAGIDVSENGWDSEMICYPSVSSVGDKLYMFYCGNNFGQNGFGYAELVAEK